MTHDDAEQPGLFADPHAAPDGAPGPIEAAAARTIKALADARALDETHALKVELIRQGARTLDRELRVRQKVSVAAIALFSRVTEIADGLPTVQQVMNSEFDRITAALQLDDEDAAHAEPAEPQP